MAFTTNFQIEKPAYKTLRFDSALNDNMDRIDLGFLCWADAVEPGDGSHAYPDIVLAEGCLWRDLTTHLLKVYGAAAWEEVVTSFGKTGGRTIPGGNASGDDLTLQSTTHGTKGTIIFGTSGYDEVNNRLGVGTQAPDQKLEIEEVQTITGAVTDGYAAGLRLDPGYTAATAQTVTRHNYIDIQDVSVAGVGPAAVTDAAVLRFNANIGTHKCVQASGTVDSYVWDGFVKINVNGTLYYIPFCAAGDIS